jgi:methylphosphotriester-DNA--protein-cysteine methyltransferase
MTKEFRLLGPDGVEYRSAIPGAFGGHRRSRIYGRLDCPNAMRWIGRGHYVQHRVFFADAVTAVAAGFRPCAICLADDYARWKSGSAFA